MWWNAEHYELLNPDNVTSKWVGTCSTAAATAAKAGTLTGYTRSLWDCLIITFSNQPTAFSTLNVNSTGAAAVRYRNSLIDAGMIQQNTQHLFMWDGQVWQLLNPFLG